MCIAYFIAILLTIARIRAIISAKEVSAMNVTIKVNIPDYIYRFYNGASQYIAECSPEKLMADALSAYAGMLSKDIAKERETERRD